MICNDIQNVTVRAAVMILSDIEVSTQSDCANLTVVIIYLVASTLLSSHI